MVLFFYNKKKLRLEKKMISDKFDIRQQNESVILKAIIDHKNISRADLSKLTGLNKASVSAIIKKMIEEHFVFETGIGNASSVGGRKPVLLEFNPKIATVISIDVGINYISGVSAYLDGKEIRWIKKENIRINRENVIDLINQIIIEITQGSYEEVRGITIGVHGVVHNNDVLFTPYYDLTGLYLYDTLKNVYPCPIFIENEANLVALGAYCFGPETQNLVGISIHSGIGAGIVIDGLLQKGVNGEAGEIGHSILFPNGIKCPCGNKGCLEQYASTSALYNKLTPFFHNKPFNNLAIKTMYEKKNELIVNTLQENAYLLSIGINNISSILSPQTIIINSQIYEIIPDLIQIVKQNLSGKFSNNIKITTSSLGEKSIVFGGVALAAQNFLNINKLKFN